MRPVCSTFRQKAVSKVRGVLAAVARVVAGWLCIPEKESSSVWVQKGSSAWAQPNSCALLLLQAPIYVDCSVGFAEMPMSKCAQIILPAIHRARRSPLPPLQQSTSSRSCAHKQQFPRASIAPNPAPVASTPPPMISSLVRVGEFLAVGRYIGVCSSGSFSRNDDVRHTFIVAVC